MIFFSKLNLPCCRFKINQYKHTYDQLAHMILLTLHSSMFTMAIIFSSFSVVFFTVVDYFRILFFPFLVAFFFIKIFFSFSREFVAAYSVLECSVLEYSVLNACVQSAESTYLNISNIQYTQVILELSSQLLFPSKRSTRLRRLPFFFNLFVLFSWPCSTSFGRTKKKTIHKQQQN